MRKCLLAVAVAFLFAMAEVAFAQAGNSGGTAGGAGGGTGAPMTQGTGSPSSQSGSQGALPEPQSEQSPSMQSGAQSSQPSTSASGNSDQKQKEKTVEGCVIRQSSDFLLVPKKGDELIRLSGGQDLSSYVGQHVKVHGIEQKTSASNLSGGTSGAMASNQGASSSQTAGGQVAPGTAEVTNPAGGTGSTSSIAGNTVSQPSGNTSSGVATESGSSSSQANASASQTWNREMSVDRVDSIGQSCPENIQKKAPAGSIGSSSMQH